MSAPNVKALIHKFQSLSSGAQPQPVNVQSKPGKPSKKEDKPADNSSSLVSSNPISSNPPGGPALTFSSADSKEKQPKEKKPADSNHNSADSKEKKSDVSLSDVPSIDVLSLWVSVLTQINSEIRIAVYQHCRINSELGIKAIEAQRGKPLTWAETFKELDEAKKLTETTQNTLLAGFDDILESVYKHIQLRNALNQLQREKTSDLSEIQKAIDANNAHFNKLMGVFITRIEQFITVMGEISDDDDKETDFYKNDRELDKKLYKCIDDLKKITLDGSSLKEKRDNRP